MNLKQPTMRSSLLLCGLLLTVVALVDQAGAFVLPPRSQNHRNSKVGGSRNGNDANGPPPPSNWEPWAHEDAPLQPLLALWGDNSTEDLFRAEASAAFRGGGGNVDSVVKGSQATLESTASFWKSKAQSVTSAVAKPFQAVGNKLSSLFTSKEKRKEQELMEQLKTMPVQRVTVPKSSVLPPQVVQLAAKRSGVLGSPLRTDRVQEFAKALKRWYARNGFVLHSVTGATLKPETATAEIEVQEPIVSKKPVGITFCKEMVVDDDTGELLTLRQYKEKHAARRTLGFDRINKDVLNTTFVETEGRTKPSRIASAMKLRPGKPFQWDGSRWQQITSSGIFSRILRAAPEPTQDGTVQLHIVATEAPARHLEYGVGRSLYTGNWEGELDFEHVNLLGGGETLGLKVCRGTKDAEPSVHLRYSDDKFGMEGGYDVEVFSDYLGVDDQVAKEQERESKEQQQHAPDYEHDALLDRKGATVSFRNPIPPRLVQHSMASASVERTSTKTGLHEKIGSVTMNVGPFVRFLPYDARSDMDARVTTGTRVAEDSTLVSEEVQSESFLSSLSFKPYSAMKATTKQILPLRTSTTTASTQRPVILALRHSVMGSTKNLPRHEARALGNSCQVRDGVPNGPVAQGLSGTAELRIPIEIPVVKTRQDAGVVVFCDWLLATKDSSSPFHRKSCVGLGMRKSLQGIPLKYDVSYSNEGKIKAMFGIGKDFNV